MQEQPESIDLEDFDITRRRLKYFTDQINHVVPQMMAEVHAKAAFDRRHCRGSCRSRRPPLGWRPMEERVERLPDWKTLVQWGPDPEGCTFNSLVFRADPQSKYFEELVKLAQECGNTVRGYFQRQISNKYPPDTIYYAKIQLIQVELARLHGSDDEA